MGDVRRWGGLYAAAFAVAGAAGHYAAASPSLILAATAGALAFVVPPTWLLALGVIGTAGGFQNYRVGPVLVADVMFAVWLLRMWRAP